MKIEAKRRQLVAALCALPVLGALPAWAQEKWPSEPIKLLRAS